MSTYMAFIIGIVVGAIIGNIVQNNRSASGTLKIDQSNPEKDIYRLVIDGKIEKLSKKKRVILKVDSDADLSQN